MDYKLYTVEDFVLNKKFRSWVLKPSTQSNLYWEKVIKEHPEKILDIKEAINVTLNIYDFQYNISQGRAQEIWNNINENALQKDVKALEREKVIPMNSQSVIGQNIQVKRKRPRYYLRYAAVLAFAILSSCVLFLVLDNGSIPEQVTQTSEWVIKKNPWGQKTTIFLSDGSEVVLNAGSTLKYMENFTGQDRTLYLDGEAFFTVSRDSLRPFRVHSGELITEALGTAFNVHAYPEEATISIALESGKVQISPVKGMNKSVTLNPGHKMEYYLAKGESLVVPFDSKEMLSWKSGIIYFKDANEQQVFSRLEKWYGVKFQTVGTTKGANKWSYTAEFTNKSLENVLQSIGFSMNFNYSINNKNVQITYQ